MRKVRNQIHSSNPLAMFAYGVESIVRDKMVNPTSYNDYELNAMARKEAIEDYNSPKHTPARGFHIVDLLQELFWSKKNRQV